MNKTYCRGCKAEEEMHRPIGQHWWARYDIYGIFTGIYCDECYNSDDADKYPYRKDSYQHLLEHCLLYTSPSPRDATLSRMPSSA